jgi:nitrite reductase/ring-hydroxylating ferredoxin subunit
MLSESRRPVCHSADLTPGSATLFHALVRGEERPCFALRLADPSSAVVAFVNICAHRAQPVVVDRAALDEAGRIECRAHGALYDPRSGECVGGPCEGARLVPITVREEAGTIWAIDDDLVDDSPYAHD